MEELIKKDIQRIVSEISKNNNESAKKLQREIVTTYKSELPDIDSELSKDMTNLYGGGYFKRGDFVENLNIIKRRLEVYLIKLEDKSNAENDSKVLDSKIPSITINNSSNSDNHSNNSNENSNENNNTVDIKVMFEQARKSINDDESLNDEEVSEIINKINRLEAIAGSNENKRGKWNKCKKVMSWLFEKGAKVATVVLPLITEVIK